MVIEIKGAQLFNHGASLMLQATLDQLSKRLPKARFALRFNHLIPRDRVGFLGLPAGRLLRKLPLRKKTWDLSQITYLLPAAVHQGLAALGSVFEGGLDAVVDISGYAYGDRWGRYSLVATASEIDRLSRCGAQYVFLPQAFGPFQTISEDDKKAFARALNRAHFVLARDDRSRDYLRDLTTDIDVDVRQSPDLTIGYAVGDKALGRYQVDRRTALFVPNIRMLDSRGQPRSEAYLETLTRLATECDAQDYRLGVLNHSEREDADLCEKLRQQWLARGLRCGPVVSERDPREIKALIGRAGLVVSSRYHACVSALDQQVPCMATSWSHKYEELFQDFEVANSIITDLDPAVARICFQSWLESPVEQRVAKAERIESLRQAVAGMWDELASVLGAERVCS
jgi:polysaccharide pyruvyl transferase WcaK-like protein